MWFRSKDDVALFESRREGRRCINVVIASAWKTFEKCNGAVLEGVHRDCVGGHFCGDGCEACDVDEDLRDPCQISQAIS